jgi:hypothetical protein
MHRYASLFKLLPENVAMIAMCKKLSCILAAVLMPVCYSFADTPNSFNLLDAGLFSGPSDEGEYTLVGVGFYKIDDGLSNFAKSTGTLTIVGPASECDDGFIGYIVPERKLGLFHEREPF